MPAKQINKLLATEMEFLRRLAGISRTYKFKNMRNENLYVIDRPAIGKR
jgi:hypothetical protein